MELRWYIRERDVTNWDDREGKNITITHVAPPILQYREHSTADWITVRTVREKQDK